MNKRRMKVFELNCDMGEGVGNDQLIMPLIDACSIACGGHTGDDQSMKTAVELALQHRKEIGAHPSFPDTANFGRVAMEISNAQLIDSLYDQVHALALICQQAGTKLGHIKLHGALYNQVMTDERLSNLVLDALLDFAHLPYLAPADSIFSKQCQLRHVRVRMEAFADRKYDVNGGLVSRNQPGSVITDPQTAVQQALKIAREGLVNSIEGTKIQVRAQTFCVHGDNPKALELLKALKGHQFED